MFKRVVRGVQHTLTIARALSHRTGRRLLWRMVAFSHGLPQQFKQPLPLMMARLTSAYPDNGHSLEDIGRLNPDDVRRLADAVAAWHFRSPLGICLRRSLLRYHFLWQAGLPVTIVFGARLKESWEGGGVGGHAWLTLEGKPYYETPGDYEGFIVMYRYPPPTERQEPTYD